MELLCVQYEEKNQGLLGQCILDSITRCLVFGLVLCRASERQHLSVCPPVVTVFIITSTASVPPQQCYIDAHTA